MKAIVLEELCYHVRSHFWLPVRDILGGVSLSVEVGEIYGFLGPNGAGKTSTISCLLGLNRPASGKVTILGGSMDDRTVRCRVGVMPERGAYSPQLTAWDLVYFHALLSGQTRGQARVQCDALLERVGLDEHKHVRIGAYSKGMVQRLGLAQALVGDAELLVLDEPLSGLDPVGRRMFRELMVGLRSEGKTIFFSTHILPDLEVICDRVGILVDGKMRREGLFTELLGSHVGRVEMTLTDCPEVLLNRLVVDGYGLRQTARGLCLEVDGIEAANELLKEVVVQGATVVDFQAHRGLLENLLVSEIEQDRRGAQ